MMTAHDFSPLYRTVVGFDRLARLMENKLGQENSSSFPPYNIELAAQDAYRITIAVAGFAESDLDIQILNNQLTVTGKRQEEDENQKFLHRGIAGRDFVRRFELADHVKVVGAALDKGLLTIDLIREVPEEAKPRSIAIQAGTAPTLLGNSKAA